MGQTSLFLWGGGGGVEIGSAVSSRTLVLGEKRRVMARPEEKLRRHLSLKESKCAKRRVSESQYNTVSLVARITVLTTNVSLLDLNTFLKEVITYHR